MLAATGLAQPALLKIANSPAFLDGKDPLNKRILLEAVKHAQYVPLCRNWSEFQGIIIPEPEKVWRGTESPAQVMERLRPLLENNPPVTL